MGKLKLLVLFLLSLLLPAVATAAPLHGTLHIPAADIEVRLYKSDTQAVTDAKNSAAMFKRNGSWIIADHNNQEFRTLPDVEPEDMAWIDREDGKTVLLVCCDVFYGKNTGHEITDLKGRNVMGDHDYLMYTCRKGKGWRNVVVTQWDETLLPPATGWSPSLKEGGLNDSEAQNEEEASELVQGEE